MFQVLSSENPSSDTLEKSVCVCVKGDFVKGGPCCKIYREYNVHVVKFIRGNYVHVANNMRGELCPSIQKWAGGFGPGG